MTDLSTTIAPKSDQLNADDLIGRTMTITVTRVRGCDEPDQPVAVHFEGDNNKPYKPCKSMRRVMVHVWGPDGNSFVGRSMTLYRDEGVQFGGIKVGGIRISHMSHIDREVTMALTATRAQRKPYTVKPLRQDQGRPQGGQQTQGSRQEAQGGGDKPSGTPTLAQRADSYEARLKGAPGTTKLGALRSAAEQLRRELDTADPERLAELDALFNDLMAQAEDREAVS